MADPIRVLVTGGRRYANRRRVWEELDALALDPGISLIVEGGCRQRLPSGMEVGADRFAAMWAQANEVPCLTVWARWRRLGNAAGPERNGRMLKMSRPHLVLAFKGSNGTADMVRKAREAGVPVREVPEDA